MPGLLVLIRARRLPQRTGSALTRSDIATLGDLVGVQRGSPLMGLQHREGEEQLGGVVARVLSCSGVRAGSRCPGRVGSVYRLLLPSASGPRTQTPVPVRRLFVRSWLRVA